MIRAPIGNLAYWNKRVDFLTEAIETKWAMLAKPSGNPMYDPQFTFDLGKYCVTLMLRLYSRGDSIRTLSASFGGVLDAWELSNRLAVEVCAEHGLETCRDWDFSLTNLNHYNYCFWLIGLALTLEISDAQWQRLLALVGGEGEDVLLDRVIASREPQRFTGRVLLHPQPYARLLAAVDAAPGQQAEALLDFVNHWYPELKRPAPKERQTPRLQPFWYHYGHPENNPLAMENYFGRWCIEAVAAVKAFGLDDSLCLGHEHYPGDLLRPDGPSSHKPRPDAGSSTDGSALKRLLSLLRKSRPS